MTEATLSDRRADAAARLERLRHERGAAVLDDRAFDSATIRAVQDEIAGLDESEAEWLRREREEGSAAAAELSAKLCTELVEKEAARLDAVGRTERAARALAAGLTEVLALGDEVNVLARRITGGGMRGLAGPAAELRFGERLSAILRLAAGGRRKFGAITIANTWRRDTDDWVESERAEFAGNIDRILKGNENGTYSDSEAT